MIKTIQVRHVSESAKVEFDAFTKGFESQLGRHDISAYEHLLRKPDAAQEVETVIKSQEGKSGFMLFTSYDHGALLSCIKGKGSPTKARQYILGNPLFAARMTEHDIRAGLYAPLRVFVYSDDSGQVTVEYDLPSSLFGQFGSEKVTEVAHELDEKLSTLINNSFGR